MCQTNIELGYIGALVGQQHGETALEAVKRVMTQARRAERSAVTTCAACGYRERDITHDRGSVVYSHAFVAGEG